MSKRKETISLLMVMGIPRQQQNERSALTLLSLLNLKEDTPWNEAKLNLLKIHDIIIFLKDSYNKIYAENTRETIRRQTLHQFVQAGLVIKNPDNPSRPTNSPNTVYGVSEEALNLIKTYKTENFPDNLNEYLKKHGKLTSKYNKIRKKVKIPLKIEDKIFEFSPGKHNKLQAKVIEDWKVRFCPDAILLYIGDTSKKMLYCNHKILRNLKVPVTQHDKLPDIILYDKDKEVLFLIEVVTSHGPMSPKRQIELEKTLAGCNIKKIYVTAFPDRNEFKRHIDNVAWETEVWIADYPEHMIHFNGPKFLYVDME